MRCDIPAPRDVSATHGRQIAARLSQLACALVTLGCAASPPLSRTPDARDDPRPVVRSAQEAQQIDVSWSRAEAVFEKRCVVCHGCYDAPCQLKLDSFAGVERGASNQKIYDTTRLTAADPTRLFVDARMASEWRQKGFHAVLPDALQPDPHRSVLFRMLELKGAHPLTREVNLGESFSLGLDREASCVAADKFDDYAEKHPLWGMPYGLPALSDEETSALTTWLDAGAPSPNPSPLSAALARETAKWEEFFNEASNKRRLAARYIYEHLFLASLQFREADDGTWFRIVRSRTPSGFPVDEIATRRPCEDPGTAKFYYRITRRDGAPLAKTHMPYVLDEARMARYKAWFVDPDYTVTALPGYDLAVSANPLTAFAELPAASRYRFMLDEAQFTIMGFIKGPVCRGQIALNVIQERFWVMFVDPDAPFTDRQTALLRDVRQDLELPAEAGSNAWPTGWAGYAAQHLKYVKQKNALVAQLASSKPGLGVDLIWNGAGNNRNAALTVFRHFDSASVVQGLVGGAPLTAWVIDYPMLERIHYLLVAGFDVFGNVGHQVLTRLYMDFLRMEGEANLLMLLPQARRTQLAHAWYRGVTGSARQHIDVELAGLGLSPAIRYSSARPELELFTRLEKHLASVRSDRYELSRSQPVAAGLAHLAALPGRAAALFPELSFLAVTSSEHATEYFTLLRDSAHTNVAELFNEDDRRRPAQDQLRVVPGFLGAYPNAIFSVRAGELETWLRAAAQLTDQASYRALRERFGVARNNPEFWAVSDAMHEAQLRWGAEDRGLFDFNRLDAD